MACGVLDIMQACVAWGIQNHLSPPRIFQSVASGLLGPKSFQGGAKTAALGLFLHFLIAFIWAVVYYVASRRISFLMERPVIAGLLYGEFVWVMIIALLCRFRPSIAGLPGLIRLRSSPGRSCIPSLSDCPLHWR